MTSELNKELIQFLVLKNEPKFLELDIKNSPFRIFKKICKEFDHCFIFESLDGPKELVESSIIGFDPKFTIKCKLRSLHLYDKNKEIYKQRIKDPLEVIRNYFPSVKNRQYRYVGGLVGFFCYEAIRFWENIPIKKDLKYPLCELGWYEDGIVFDHKKNKLEYFYYDKSRIERIKTIVDTLESNTNKSKSSYSNLKRSINKKDFEKKVNQIKRHLLDGDIFQTVLSKKITFEYKGDSLDLYEQLRRINPSPYMFFVRMGGRSIVGSSPEMLVRVEGRNAVTHPIAGTRPRGRSDEEDQRLAEELKRNEKERAEHVMLVDLGRNDLGRVCEYGSVRVPTFMALERYSHVMHLVSVVEGKLAEDRDRLDALVACFPAGTVSGAPKVRAMQIINALEPVRRGIYAGAVGYLDFAGNLDFCIAIRTIVLERGQAHIQAGAGIVADSNPTAEYEETRDKARAMVRALELAMAGL